MKGCITDANLEGQRWKAALLTNLLVLTWGLRYFSKKKEHQKKIED